MTNISISPILLTLGLKINTVIGNNVIVEKNAVLDDLKQELVNDVLSKWTDQSIKNNPILSEYRSLHHLCIEGKGDEYIASPEFLLKCVLKNKRFININNIVDCYNIISTKYHLAIGSHDLDKIEGQLKISEIAGNERFIPLGMGDAVSVPHGAYALSDDKEILCLFESRQANKTKITQQTANFITYLQGNSQTSDQYIQDATYDLLHLYQRYCRGSFIQEDNKTISN